MPRPVIQIPRPSPNLLASIFGHETTPTSEPTIRPPTTSESVWDALQSGAETLGLDKLYDLVYGSDPETQIANAAFPTPVAAGFLPKDMARRFARDVAADTWENLKHLPKVADASQRIIERQPLIAGHLASIKPVESSVFRGQYQPKASAIPAILKREHPFELPKLSDEELMRHARLWGGEIRLNQDLENDSLLEIMKTIRHEFSHAADDLMPGRNRGPGFAADSSDPRYWVNLAEVRARATEPNAFRDIMGRAPYEPFARPKLSDKIAEEIDIGHRIGTQKLEEPLPSNVAVNADRMFNKELEETASHYFGSPGYRDKILRMHPRTTIKEPIPPRLEPPESMVPFEKFIRRPSGPTLSYYDLARRFRE